MKKRLISAVLTFAMVLGMLPVTALAAHDSTGRPTDVKDDVVLAIYTKDDVIPGEPNVQDTSSYKSFNSSFDVKSGAFASSAEEILDPEIIHNLTQGTGGRYVNSVWGVFDTSTGVEKWFDKDATFLTPENEKKIIEAIKGSGTGDRYEILWYVIKYQESGSWLLADEWHINGIIKEKNKYTINYNANGDNISGGAPAGTSDIGDGHTVQGAGSMSRKDQNRRSYTFLGWNDEPDGSGNDYPVGYVITSKDYPSGVYAKTLYAQWKAPAGYTVTVNTFLNGYRRDATVIHGNDTITLHLLPREDEGKPEAERNYIDLTRSSTGQYTVYVADGVYDLYHKESGHAPHRVGTYSVVIAENNGAIDVNHYSVSYSKNDGTPGTNADGSPMDLISRANYFSGTAVNVTTDVPERTGYLFTGWKDLDGTIYQPGQVLTTGIAKQHHLVAQWADPVNVSVTLVFNNQAEGGADGSTSRDATITLTQKLPGSDTYTEVAGSSEELTGVAVNTGATGVTFSNLWIGLDPSTPYSANVLVHNYNVRPQRDVTVDANGDYHVTLYLDYDPEGFDLSFNVVVDSSVPENYIPQAVDLKISFWNGSEWEYIDAHDPAIPALNSSIDVALGGARNKSGTYHVWGFRNVNQPYYYRVEVFAVDVDNTTTLLTTESTQEPNKFYYALPYYAEVEVTNGGAPVVGALPGAYGSKEGDVTVQKGTITVTLKMNSYDVTFNAAGGKVNDNTTQKVSGVYQIPNLSDYVPVREGGYAFEGWYYDADGDGEADDKAAGGEWLTRNVTLTAKWREPLTIRGTVTVDASYLQGEDIIDLNENDRLKKVTVRLWREGQSGSAFYQTVTLGDYTKVNGHLQATGHYSFTGVPDEGFNYQIVVEHVNFVTTYDNESDSDSQYGNSANEQVAVFNGDKIAEVNAWLEFVPDGFLQQVQVDASQIGEGFRPGQVTVSILYRDLGDVLPYNTITQHTVDPFGIVISLNEAGMGTGTESLWKRHVDGTFYENRANLVYVGSTLYNSSTFPYAVRSSESTVWDTSNNRVTGGEKDAYNNYTGVLKLTLEPKQYPVIFDLNLGGSGDTVTGMEVYATGGDTYATMHIWSKDTPITAAPVRSGYVFTGWKLADGEPAGAYADGKITAATAEEITLVAQWQEAPSCVVHYYLKDTTTSLLPDEVTTRLTHGDSITKHAPEIPGYTVDKHSETIAPLNYGPNVITFFYTPRTDLSYTVYYLRQDTNVPLAPAKTESGKTLGAVVTETAVDIAGYTVKGPAEQSLTIGGGENVITFHYAPRTDLTLTVHYLDKDSGDPIWPTKVVESMKMGAVVNVEELKVPITGYSYYSHDPDTVTIKADDAQNVLNMYYEKKTYSYTVQYFYDGVHDTHGDKGGNALYGTVLQLADLELPVKVEHGSAPYALDHVNGLPLTIGTDVNQNVIEVYYVSDADQDGIPDKYDVTVTYRIQNGTWFGGGSGEIVENFCLKTRDTNGNLVDANPVLGNTLPVNMSPITGYDSGSGRWDENITAATPVTGDVTYNYRYHAQNKYDLVIRVINGRVTEVYGVAQDTREYNVYDITHDAEVQSTFKVEPDVGYALESVTLDGEEQALKYVDGKPDLPFDSVDRKGDHAIVVTYGKDSDGDGVADKFQKKVAFKVVNGKWNDGSTADIVEWVTLLKDGKADPTGSGTVVIPGVGEKPDTGHKAGGWDQVPTETVSGTDAVTYTYTYERKSYTIAISVSGGSASPASSTTSFLYDPTPKTVTFTPADNYILDSYVITDDVNLTGAVLTEKEVGGKTVYTYDYDHARNLNISVKFMLDADGSGVPDDYERKVIFKVVNGTWSASDGGGSDPITRVGIVKGGRIDSITVPTGMIPAFEHKATGTWNDTLGSTITVTDESPMEQTYTYTFPPSVIENKTAYYQVEHYWQMGTENYEVHETETFTFAYRVVDNVVDENSYRVNGESHVAGTPLTANHKTYDEHHVYNGEVAGTVKQLTVTASGGAVSFDHSGVMKLYYPADKHSITYDLNEGQKAPYHPDDYYTDQINILHGASVTLKAAPLRTGHNFLGWYLDLNGNGNLAGEELADTNRYAAGSSRTLTADRTLIARWEPMNNLSYTVNYREKGTNQLIADSKTVGSQTFGTTVYRSASDVKVIDHFTFDDASSTASVTIGMGENIFNLYYTRNSYEYSVEYYYDEALEEDETVTGLTAPYGSTVSTYTDKSKPGYVIDHVVPVTITGTAANNVLKVYYKATIGNAEVTFNVVNGKWEDDSTSKTVNVTLTAGKGTMNAGDIPSGTPNIGYANGAWDKTPDTSYVITGDTTFTYTYAARTDLSYTVYYLRQDSHVAVADHKTAGGKTLGTTVSESAKVVPGYNLVGSSSQNLVIGGDESKNVITFYYTPHTDLQMTVYYVDSSAAPIGPVKKVVTGMKMGAEVNAMELAVPIEGYSYVAQTPNPMIIGADNDQNALTLTYNKNSYPYTVKYYYDGVYDVGVDSTPVPYRDVVELNDLGLAYKVQKDSVYYALDDVKWIPLTIGADPTKNIIEVYYALDADQDGIPDKYDVTVTYRVKNGKWASGNTDDIVEIFTLKQRDANGLLVDANPTLAGTIPTGMTSDTHSGGEWDESISDSTSVTESVTYNYIFHNVNQKVIVVRAVNGTVKINGTSYDAEYSATVNQSDTEKTEAISVTAAPGYALKSVLVGADGQSPVLTEPATQGDIPSFLAHDKSRYVVVTFAKDEDGDGVPDEYQKKITFRVVNGEWNDGGTTDIVDWVTLTAGTGTITFPEVGTKPQEPGYQAGSWDKLGTSVTGLEPEVYTYTYERKSYTIKISVTGGTAYPATSTTTYLYDPATKKVEFTPFANFILDSFTVKKDGEKQVGAELTGGKYTYDHAHDWEISAVFKLDAGGLENVPDEYERKVIFKVEGGTWKNGGTGDDVKIVDIRSGNTTIAVPTDMKAAQDYKQSSGQWNEVLDEQITLTESSPMEKTYIYTFQPSVIVTNEVPYTVEHYLQQGVDTYQLQETEHLTSAYTVTDDVVTAYATSVTAAYKDYGTHYSPYGVMSDTELITAVSGNSVYFVGSDVMRLYYKADTHSATYDLAGGSAPEGVNYTDQTNLLHGTVINLKAAPVRAGYDFLGWYMYQDTNKNGKLDVGEAKNSVSQEVGSSSTLTMDRSLVAGWERKNLSYTVNYYEVGSDTKIATSEIRWGQVYGTTVNRSDLPSDLIKNIPHYTLAETESTDAVTIGLEDNVFNLYYTKNSYGYRVEYYFNNVREDSKTENGTAPYGTTISTHTDHSRFGYELLPVTPVTVTDPYGNNVLKVYYKPVAGTATVTFKVVNGKWSDNSTTKTITVDLFGGVGTLSSGSIPAKTPDGGYGGGSWDVTPNTALNGITGDVTYTYTYVAQGGGGGGGGGILPPSGGTAKLTKVDSVSRTTKLANVVFELYKVGATDTLIGSYATGANGEIQVSGLEAGDYYWVETRPAAGYQIDSTKRSFAVADGQTKEMTVTNVRSRVPGVFSGDHYSYIVGYGDGKVHPEANITRAEVATIFFRMLDDSIRAQYMTSENTFPDVNKGHWFNTAVSTMAAMGIVNGYPNGNFGPTDQITRAEFAAIAARFEVNGNTSDASFRDIYGHWGEKEINIAANNGWVLGYTDGTFQPNQPITRAEAMAMVNRVLQRIPETTADLLPGMVEWPDNADRNKWYYLTVQEATNSHDYEKRGSGYEKWTRLRDPRDWAALEREAVLWQGNNRPAN